VVVFGAKNVYTCMHVTAQIIPIETVPGIRGGGIKGRRGRGEFKYDIVDTL
jgi:hypothetical protein